MSELSTQVVLPSPKLDWQAGQPISQQFNDPYFSADNGLAESRYVFLQHNGLPERWQRWPWQHAPSFNIIETGFGTGLNFLTTWQAWQQQRPQQQGWLHFTSIEKYPLSKEQLIQALALWPELAELSDKLIQHYPLPLQGAHHLCWPEERISLTLWFADVKDALKGISAPVHAWYLDGFAPSRNPDMWSDELFHDMRRISQQSHFASALLQPTVATFTAAGLVKRGLQGAGFEVSKTAGFGRKRDMLQGQFNFSQGPEQPSYYWQKPWLQQPALQPGNIAVIGAGLAGSYSARALAERGFKVTVFDKLGIANGTSGNAQGGIYIKLSAADSAIHSNFYLSAFQYALTSFERYLGKGDSNNPYWQQCGLIQLAFDEAEQQRQQRYLSNHSLPSEFLQGISSEQASAIAGLPLNQGGLFFPQAGWASPKDLCEHLLQHPNIEFIQEEIIKLSPSLEAQQPWQLVGAQQSYGFSQVVLANANSAKNLLPEEQLPLKNVRGQLSYLDAKNIPTFNTVISGQCYLAPALNQQVCLGATFNLNDNDPSLRDSDHQQNLDNLLTLGEPWQATHQVGLNGILGGRVGFRCSAPDYLPLVGSLPLKQRFIKDFAQLGKDRRLIPKKPYNAIPGLWLNIAHGAKGLVSAPLCAEILASQIAGAVLPVPQSITEALWPGRFLMKDIVRGKIAVTASDNS